MSTTPRAGEEPRAFELLTAVPAGCRLILISDDYGAPHLNLGEFAIVESIAAGQRIRDGEAAVIAWSSGAYPVQLRRHREGPGMGTLRWPRGVRPETCWWAGPLKRNTDEDLARFRRGERVVLRTSDGPMPETYLRTKLLGRIVGVYASPVAERTHALPVLDAGRRT